MTEHNRSSVFVRNFNDLPLGSSERLILAYWQLGMKRFHTFSDKCSKELQDSYDHINHELGVQVLYIDLESLNPDDHHESQIMSIIRGERPTWIWFINCNALINSSRAGWLRSVLTTYYVEHLRVTFLLESREQFRSIFQTYSAPFYQSTKTLDLIED